MFILLHGLCDLYGLTDQYGVCVSTTRYQRCGRVTGDGADVVQWTHLVGGGTGGLRLDRASVQDRQ